jgi:arylsulfatase A
MKTRRLKVLFLALMALVVGGTVCRGADSAKPNILLVLADDFGRELLRAYGGQKDYQTPRLDRLAREGMRFENCYATPLCSPSRVELLTGRYSFRNYTQWGRLNPGEMTFAQRLREAGYATALAGKWQLGGWTNSPPGIVQAGFDEYCTYDEEEDQAGGEKQPVNWYWGGKFIRNGKTSRLDRYGPDVDTDLLVDFMQRHRNRPFLAYYCMTLVHRPFHATPEHPQAPAAGQQPPEAWLRPHGTPEHFPAMVRYADRMVGKLLDALDRLGLADNTLVIFIADNGTDNVREASNVRTPFLGREVRGGKYFPTELGVNVPLLVRWPGRVAGGSTCAALVDFTDVFPTLCETASAGLPAKHLLDGRSLLPLLRGETKTHKSFLYTWGNFEQNSSKYKQPARNTAHLLDVVRDERWKLYSDGRLYDLKQDFLERNVVAPGLVPEADEARGRLERQMKTLRNSSPRLW